MIGKKYNYVNIGPNDMTFKLTTVFINGDYFDIGGHGNDELRIQAAGHYGYISKSYCILGAGVIQKLI